MKHPSLLRAALAAAVCLGLAPLVASCHDVAGQSVALLSQPALDGDVTDDVITLTEGTSVVVRIVLIDVDGYVMESDGVTWRSSNGNASIAPFDEGIYIVTGLAAGDAELTGGDPGAEPGRIQVTVVAQGKD